MNAQEAGPGTPGPSTAGPSTAGAAAPRADEADTGGSEPRDCARRAVTHPELPPGRGDRAGGYGVMGLPFASGHYLALRHFTASSFGPAYRSVWHRDPQGRWTVHADVPPEVSCARFLGPALTAARTARIGIDWTGPRSVTVTVDGVLTWSFELGTDAATWLMSTMGARMPASACHAAWLLGPMGRAAGPVLSAGRMRLHGTMPAGQVFGAMPRRVWRIVRTEAQVDGADPGPPGPLEQQVRLGGFLLPQRGIFFADAAAVFTDPR
ncbi:hypothetical protein [Tomitella gaofuii]|uniref:hypothetical protein n=1 Tax=Tomitella gaofuii TaxID=2760083 RepID=UPI001C710E4B|nr:hypothetical protein [Tomitella gaofuii]